MRHLISISCLITILILGPASSNPVVEHFMSELLFQNREWRLELIALEDLEGCFLTSLTDTAWFDTTLAMEDYLVVGPDDLQQSLHINPQGDILCLWNPEVWPEYPIDQLIFGELPATMISAPPSGYSISLMSETHYLDASPTLGEPNDTLDAMGDIAGSVTDSLGSPIEGVEVYYGEDGVGNPLYALTGSTGEFQIHSIATRLWLTFISDDCPMEHRDVQFWPDSISTIEVTLQCELDGDSWPGTSALKLTSQPNPARNEIRFSYTLPMAGPFDIKVYDLRGRLIETLMNGNGEAGSHTVVWDTSGVPSGVYICKLTARGTVVSTRCILSG